MFNRIISVVILTLTIAGAALAADKPTAEERLVGGTFKNLARAYVATANIEELKKKNIHRIQVMRPDWFRKKYAEVYSVARSLPPGIKSKYGLTEEMEKDKAVAIVRIMDKPRLYEIIDNLPDQAIADQFFQHQSKDDEGGKGQNLLSSIRQSWDGIVTGLNKPPKKPAARH